MKIIELEQNTPKWLEWRKSGVGASDFPCIIKKNPYCPADEIYRSKTDPNHENIENQHMKRGKDYEQAARAWFESQMGQEYPPLCCASDKSNQYLASLDGYNKKYRELLEIKVPLKQNFYKYSVAPPEYHLYQVQWQLFVSGAQTGYIVYYNPEEDHGVIKLVNYDPELVEEHLEKVDYFLECVKTGTKPEKLLSYPLIVNDNDLESLCSEYFKLKDQADAARAKMAEIKKEIVSQAKADKVQVGPYSLRKSTVKRIDYKRACEENEIPLSLYEKELTDTWTISKK